MLVHQLTVSAPRAGPTLFVRCDRHRPDLDPSADPTFLSDMVPPFLAYYGVVNGNTSLIQMAYDQCRLYRQYLRTPETGLWRHILWGSNPDDGLWATGACFLSRLREREPSD